VKIIDITEFYSERGGGIRSHLEVRGQFLCRLGHEHLVIAPGPRNEETKTDASNAPTGGARVVRVKGPALPYDRTYHLLAHFHKIRLRVRSERPDVLEAHSPYLGAAAVVACGRGAAPLRTCFWHADHIATYLVPPVSAKLGSRAAGAMDRALAPLIRTLLAPFDATFVAGLGQAERLRRAGARDVVHVPFGVDIRTFHPGQRSEARRRELLGGSDGPLLVAAGRLAFEKRWDVVLEAFGKVRTTHSDAVLVVFGDGPERARLERAAPPGVRFAGFERDRARLASALACADVLVHGCPYETFGLAIAEAVACGLPVVVPDAGGAAGSADPATGVLYPSLDALACAEGVKRVLESRGYAARDRALAAAARVPTAEAHVRAVLSAYEDLLRTHR
jgi:alpha-1,6-mannosyltransferase